MTEHSSMTRNRARKPKWPRRFLILVMLVLLLGGVGYANRASLRGVYDQLSGVEFSGAAGENVSFTVNSGDTGTLVAKHLVSKGVTKDFSSTLRHIIAAGPTFFPGTYKLPSQISSDEAIKYLTDPKYQARSKVTIPEGLRLVDIYKRLSTATEIPISKFEAAGRNLKNFGLPRTAPSLEGYLFPATYSFDPELSATEILSTMVSRMKDELGSFGIAKKDWQRTLTLASVIQREARLHDDFYKVSRVFQNRLNINMPLQSCATASYGVGEFSIIVTNRILNDDNPYNTYKYTGLPRGPIAAPGSLAIDAALHPADGTWLYFVTWNLETGETIFSNTYAEHLVGVAKWDKWMAENPGWNG